MGVWLRPRRWGGGGRGGFDSGFTRGQTVACAKLALLGFGLVWSGLVWFGVFGEERRGEERRETE